MHIHCFLICLWPPTSQARTTPRPGNVLLVYAVRKWNACLFSSCVAPWWDRIARVFRVSPLELDLCCRVEFTECVWVHRGSELSELDSGSIGVMLFLSSLLPVLMLLLCLLTHFLPDIWKLLLMPITQMQKHHLIISITFEVHLLSVYLRVGNTFCSSLSTRKIGCYCLIIYRR